MPDPGEDGEPEHVPYEIRAECLSRWIERNRAALMTVHADDWDMETISEAAHICAHAQVLATFGVSTGPRHSGRDQDPLTEHLSQPCDEPGCDAPATHNGYARSDGPHGPYRGKFCNAHTSWDHPAFARDD